MICQESSVTSGQGTQQYLGRFDRWFPLVYEKDLKFA